jgi:TolB-like protein
LIDSLNGSHAWADRFEGDLDDVFELQDPDNAGHRVRA